MFKPSVKFGQTVITHFIALLYCPMRAFYKQEPIFIKWLWSCAIAIGFLLVCAQTNTPTFFFKASYRAAALQFAPVRLLWDQIEHRQKCSFIQLEHLFSVLASLNFNPALAESHACVCSTWFIPRAVKIMTTFIDCMSLLWRDVSLFLAPSLTLVGCDE